MEEPTDQPTCHGLAEAERREAVASSSFALRLNLQPADRPRGLLVLLLLAALATLVGCTRHNVVQGRGPLVVEERQLADASFDRVSLDSAIDAVVRIDPEVTQPLVRVIAEENLLPLIDTQVRRGTLYIRSNRSYSTRRGVRVEVVTPELIAARVRGSGDMLVQGIDAVHFAGAVSGSGDLRLQGTAREVDLRLSGSGDIRAAQLQADLARAAVSGSGNIVLTAQQSLNASVAGSGDILCHGSPPDVRRSVTGSGRVRVR